LKTPFTTPIEIIKTVGLSGPTVLKIPLLDNQPGYPLMLQWCLFRSAILS